MLDWYSIRVAKQALALEPVGRLCGIASTHDIRGGLHQTAFRLRLRAHAELLAMAVTFYDPGKHLGGLLAQNRRFLTSVIFRRVGRTHAYVEVRACSRSHSSRNSAHLDTAFLSQLAETVMMKKIESGRVSRAIPVCGERVVGCKTPLDTSHN